MTAAAPTQRLCCAICLRAQSACICQWITPTAHRVEVLVLQHPLELGHAKGSAQLLQLSLADSRLVSGEVFAAPLLRALLSVPRQPQAGAVRRPSVPAPPGLHSPG